MLVGGFNPSENMKVNWDDDIPNIWKNQSHVPNHKTYPKNLTEPSAPPR